MKYQSFILVLWSVLALGFLGAPMGCDEDSNGEGDADSDTDADSDGDVDTGPEFSIVATIAAPIVPGGFECSPANQIQPSFFDTFPPPEGAMPVGLGEATASPVIDDDGTDFELTTKATTLSGESLPEGTYYMAVALYCGTSEGPMPADGDWVGASSTPIKLPQSEDVDLGTITLEPF